MMNASFILWQVLAFGVVVVGGRVGEYGGVYSPQVTETAAPTWVLVELQGDYERPVLFGAVPSDTGDDETIVRFRNLRRGLDCPGWCFDLRVQEPACRDGAHDGARVGWMALEEGVFSFAPHRDASPTTLFEVGKATVGGDGSSFVDVDFDPFFVAHGPRKVTIVTHVQTYNIPEFVKTRQGQRADGEPGFSVSLDTSSGPADGSEVVGWLGVPPGSGLFGGYPYRAETATDMVTRQSHIIDFASAFRDRPYIFASIASFDTSDRAVLRVHDVTTQFATVYIGAEQCASSTPPTQEKETVHFLALPGILGHSRIIADVANVADQPFYVAGSVIVDSEYPYQLYANGRFVGSRGAVVQAQTWSFRSYIRSLTAVLAISVQRAGVAQAVTGFSVDATLNGMAYSGHWKCGTHAEQGWKQEDFDDSAWEEAATDQIWASADAGQRQMFCRLRIPVTPRLTSTGKLPIGEKGSLAISSEWRTVELSRHYQKPVVLGGMPSYANSGEANVRIRGIRNGRDGCAAWCFDIRLQEPPCRNDRHVDEYVSWLVAEAGTYASDEGSWLEVATQTAGSSFQPIRFGGIRSAADCVVIAQVQTSHSPGFMRIRATPANAEGFSIALEGTDTVFSPAEAATETVGWLVLSAGTGHIGGLAYSASNGHIRSSALVQLDFNAAFGAVPLLFGTISSTERGDTSLRLVAQPLSTSGTQVLLQEDECTTEVQRPDANLGFFAVGASAGTLHAKAATVRQSQVDSSTDVFSRTHMHGDGLFSTDVLRFDGVPVDGGESIIVAQIRLFSIQEDAETTLPAQEIRGYANDSCTDPSLNAPTTAARVSWAPDSWIRGGEFWTPDLSSIILELTQRPGWKTGNSICITIRSRKAPSLPFAAFTDGYEKRHAPVLSIMTEPCAGVDCGDKGFCVSGSCVCIDGFFGDRCEIPPGPPLLCDPIKERYLPLVALHCGGRECTADCVQLSMPLYDSERWLWRRFSTICDLQGAVDDLGLAAASCARPTPINATDDGVAPASSATCAWRESRCIASVDKDAMAEVGPRYGAAGHGKGFQACFAALEQDSCEVMEWCWWQATRATCEPRTHSMLTVALAALSQWDTLYDATLDPHGHILHLADECGRHSPQVCGMLRSCAWSQEASECLVASHVIDQLMKSPSCSAVWTQAASCRGRPAVECVGACAWSAAAESCLLSPQMSHVSPPAVCAAAEQCMDDAWGILDVSGLTCEDVLSHGTCSFDLSLFFPSWPAGMQLSSICQASCGECGDPCADQDICPELVRWWSQGEGGGCASSGGTLSQACPRTCGLCTGSASHDGMTNLQAAERDVASAYGSSFAAVHEAAASQMQYGIGAVAARAQVCVGNAQPNCTASDHCEWSDDAELCSLQPSEAMRAFLGDASLTPLGGALLQWSAATDRCALLQDERSCVSTSTAANGHPGPDDASPFGESNVKLAPVAALAGLLAVWAFGTLVLGRNGKKQKTGADTHASGILQTPFDADSQFKSPMESGQTVVPEAAEGVGAQQWSGGAGYEAPEIPSLGPDAGVPWGDYMSDAETAFHLPYIGDKESGARSGDSAWEDTGSDSEAYSSGAESHVGGAASPHSENSTPDTLVDSSTPPNLSAIEEEVGSVESFITGLTYEDAAALSCAPDGAPPAPPSEPSVEGSGPAAPRFDRPRPPATFVSASAAPQAVAGAGDMALGGGAFVGEVQNLRVPVQLPPSARSSAGKGGQRKRKLTEQKKEAVTGTVFMLCQSGALPAVEQVPRTELQSRYNINPVAEDGSIRCGVLLRYGSDSKRTKLLLATALNDVFCALDWDLAQPVEKPVKWGTIQRDILWKYQKREGCDSVYLFTMDRVTMESYAAAIEARLRKPIAELLADTHRRVEAAGAELVAAERARGGAAQQRFYCPVEGCDYSTPERRYVMGHMRVHTGHKPFKCPVEGCGYASYSSQHLTRHARVHSGERPFKCTWEGCGYAASQKGHLQSHMLTHQGLRPFVCGEPGCDFACTRSWHLERHKRKHLVAAPPFAGQPPFGPVGAPVWGGASSADDQAAQRSAAPPVLGAVPERQAHTPPLPAPAAS